MDIGCGARPKGAETGVGDPVLDIVGIGDMLLDLGKTAAPVNQG